MTPDEIQRRVDELFDKASQLNAEELSALLDRECEKDPPELRAEVEKLWEAYADTEFFKPAPLPGMEHVPRIVSHDPAIGKQVGDYTIRRRLGQGGFGIVYLAERTGQYEQKVAVKVIRADAVADENVIQRFELERQALADLQHQYIARLLDGGETDGGGPFFVMEYVDGQPITDYCDGKCLGVMERLALFQKVCEALKYAHEFGYIHRDVKPSNILVTNDGIPKVLDFGLAKLVDARSRMRQITITEHGFVGTPEYASPEQVKADRKSICAATDVYGLGVLLYQLLTGHLPHDLSRLLLSEAVRVICEEQPRRPSTVVMQPLKRQSNAGADVTVAPDLLSEKRHSTPAQLRKLLSGDLGTIVLKALQKEVPRRYATAAAFSDDITNYLKQLPVEARPDSGFYRLRKFATRHRGPVIAASLLFVSLVSGMVVSTTFWLESNRNAERAMEFSIKYKQEAENSMLQASLATGLRIQAEAERERAETNLSVARGLTRELIAATEELLPRLEGQGRLRRDTLRASRQLLQELAAEQPANRELRRDLAQLHRIYGNVVKSENRDSALREMESASRILEQLLNEGSDDRKTRDRLAETLNDYGSLLADHGRIRASLEAYERSRRLVLKLRDEQPNVVDYIRTKARLDLDMGGLQVELGDFARAWTSLSAAANGYRQLAGSEQGHWSDPVLLLMTQNRQAEILRRQQEVKQSSQILAAAVADGRKLLDDVRVQNYLKNVQHVLARLLLEQSHVVAFDSSGSSHAKLSLDEAIQIWEQLVDKWSDGTRDFVYQEYLARALTRRGAVFLEDGELGDAKADFDRARLILDRLEKRFPADPAYRSALAVTMAGLSKFEGKRGNASGSEAFLAAAIRLQRGVVEQIPESEAAQNRLKTLETSTN